MTIAGISIILILGICNLLLIFFQAASGLRIFKVKIGVHKKTGLALVVFAVAHGLLAFLVNL
ncbi:MAG: hypothetical protein JW747_07785 [Candidatus Aminicenantes bacterium]|nr:hypothetical protein [Candidatus Aminicenantes bacterium]